MASISSISDLLSLIPNETRLLTAQGRNDFIVENMEQATQTRRGLTNTLAAFKAFMQNPPAGSSYNAAEMSLLYLQGVDAEKKLSDGLNKAWGEINAVINKIRPTNPDAAEKIRAWSVQTRSGGGLGAIAIFLVVAATALLAVIYAIWQFKQYSVKAAELKQKLDLAYLAATGTYPPQQQSTAESIAQATGFGTLAILGVVAFLAFRK